MRAMFTMMNAARLGVGIQGLALAEPRYQSALAYARDRLQGRSLAGPKCPDKPADPLIVHPDIRRMLLRRGRLPKAAARWRCASRRRDRRAPQHHPATRSGEDLVALLTPIVKALLTDPARGAEPRAGRCSAATATSARRAWSSSCATRASRRSTRARTACRRSTWSAASCPRAPAASSAASSTRPRPARRGGRRRADRRRGGAGAGRARRLRRATLWLAEHALADPEEAGAAATEYQQYDES